MPDEQERQEILEIELDGTELADVPDRAAAIKDLAQQTEGFAGADLASLVEQAKLYALEEDALGGLKQESLLAILENTRSFRLAQSAPL
jgi:SpoVK/Ycf46/Vps4 family AAA+-type ATPase